MEESIVIPTAPETTTDAPQRAKRAWVSPHFEAIELKSAESSLSFCNDDGTIFSGC